MEKEEFILESYPDHIQARIEKRNREKAKNAPNLLDGKILELVLDDLKLWRVGTLNVSFKGGNSELHKKIAETASIWSQYANIVFDFGYNESDDSFRSWHPDDDSHIRVGFEYPGYWSLVGNDSVDTEIAPLGAITLNLSEFDRDLPSNWEGTVLHEFGHALGFHHEHQSPDLECDFDWPLLYDYLGGSPNFWPKHKVDHNLRQLRKGGLTYSAHDKNSIMHYSFPSWMFILKDNSPCFTDENNELSEEDKLMASKGYPFEDVLVEKVDSRRISNLERLVAVSPSSNSINSLHSRHLEYYKNITKK